LRWLFQAKRTPAQAYAKEARRPRKGRGSLPGLGGGVREGIGLEFENAGLHLTEPRPLILTLVVVPQQMP